MKFKVFCAYTFLSICLINNNCFNDIQSYSFCNNTQNNFNQLIENIQKDDPYNISEIKNYLAPSYFAFIESCFSFLTFSIILASLSVKIKLYFS